MTSRIKYRLIVSAGFVTILVTMGLGTWPVYLRGLLVLAGGWQMAIGIIYQVELFAQQKNSLYYTLLMFAGIFGLCMIALTLFWLDSFQ